MLTLICSLPLTSSGRGLQVEDMEQKNARKAVLTVCSGWETSVEQSSVLISEVQRNSLRHRRPSCFRFTQLSAFPARTPQNSSFVKAPHPLLQVHLTILTYFHILYPLFLEVAIERSSWHETSNTPKDESDCDCLSPSAQMRVSYGPLYPQQN